LASVNRFLKDYFTFNKSERRGIFVLLAIIVLLIAFHASIPHFVTKRHYDFAAFAKDVETFEANRIILEETRKSRYERRDFDFKNPDKSAGVSKLTPFPFNPAEMQAGDWKKLGLTDKQVRTIENYRSKGGSFRIKNDVRKLYCISPEEYEILEPYIQLPETLPPKEFSAKREPEKKIIVELNTASDEELQQLKGIGKYFAEKIIKRRNALGGYCHAEQLREIPKMDSSRYEQILPFIEINQAAILKMDINTVSFEELSKHPYIGYNVALSLTNYRAKHGPFLQLPDIKKSALVTETLYAKISPYLKAVQAQ
jgi:competence protein ComEA